jgi:antitoxin PrlF
MSSAAITTKGQITIPKAIRTLLGVGPGDRLAFRTCEDGTVKVEAENIELLSLKGILKPRRKGVTIDEMNEAIRDAGRR